MENSREKTKGKQPNTKSQFSLDSEQVKQIYATLDKLINQNQLALQRIIRLNPSFNYDLFEAKKRYGFGWSIQRQLKVKEIERLLEQKETLAKFQQEELLKKQFREDDQMRTLKNQTTQFRFCDLKSILKSVGNQNLSSPDRIDKLNQVVKDIKNKVDTELINQKNQIRFPNQNYSNPCVGTKTFWKLQQRLLETQKILKILSKENRRLREKIKQKQQQVLTVSQQVQELRNKIKRYEGSIQNIQISQSKGLELKHSLQPQFIQQHGYIRKFSDQNRFSAFERIQHSIPNQDTEPKLSLKLINSKKYLSSQHINQVHSGSSLIKFSQEKFSDQDKEPIEKSELQSLKTKATNRQNSLASFYSDSNLTLQRTLKKQICKQYELCQQNTLLKKNGTQKRFQRMSVKKYQENQQRYSVATVSTGQLQ